MNPLPLHIVTGFLGTGKTTTLREWIGQKPENERWLLIINEFGKVGIDASILKSGKQEGLSIYDISGGCMCCSANLKLQATLGKAVRKEKPDRLLIEPTGLGHLGSLLKTLRSELYKDVFQIQPIVAIVNPQHWFSQKHRNHETWNHQLNAASVVLYRKADLVEETDLQRFRQEFKQQFPEKDLLPAPKFDPFTQEGNKAAPSETLEDSHWHQHPHTEEGEVPQPSPEQPVLLKQEEDGNHALGVRIHESELVDSELLQYRMAQILQQYEARIKGLVHTDKGDFLIQDNFGKLAWEPNSFSGASEWEIITTKPLPEAWQNEEFFFLQRSS